MLKAIRILSPAAALAVGLTGCVGSAGVSTWNYQAGPGYETQRVYDGRVQADTSRGLARESCTTVSRRQVGPSGRLDSSDDTACSSN
ncbi:hypothetical protein [Microvirga sesbaniae]|uniref:hypothetical protein n=1 Tax=Microvirga sesbaniae TaxID=681392 RepID=UPI0021CADAAF|nr:hypothetical protein [Microvirga sp. HBU67692]